MGRRMKSFNIFGFHGKIRVLRRGDHEKPIYRGGGGCLNGDGPRQFADGRWT